MVQYDRERSGVYELADEYERVIFIGSSSNLKRRLFEHLAETKVSIGRHARKYRTEYTSDYEAREQELYEDYVKKNGTVPFCNLAPTTAQTVHS